MATRLALSPERACIGWTVRAPPSSSPVRAALKAEGGGCGDARRRRAAGQQDALAATRAIEGCSCRRLHALQDPGVSSVEGREACSPPRFPGRRTCASTRISLIRRNQLHVRRPQGKPQRGLPSRLGPGGG